MEFNTDFNDLEIEEELTNEFEVITEKTLIPKFGRFLGLDISQDSSGLCLYEEGMKKTYSFPQNIVENSNHREVLARRFLKSKIMELTGGGVFDLIIIEDVFQGINPYVTRLLYSLNTAIDELIIDGEIECKEFKRIQNQAWKSWLATIDTERVTKGYEDKLKIETCLGMLGVHEEGEGFQDRLDATGMLLGYFLCKENIKVKEEKKKRVSFEDIEIYFEGDTEIALMCSGDEVVITSTKLLVNDTKWSKTKIIDFMTEYPDRVVTTENLVKLGKLAYDLDLPYLDDGGILTFWVKPKKRKKYIIEEEIDNG